MEALRHALATVRGNHDRWLRQIPREARACGRLRFPSADARADCHGFRLWAGASIVSRLPMTGSLARGAPPRTAARIGPARLPGLSPRGSAANGRSGTVSSTPLSSAAPVKLSELTPAPSASAACAKGIAITAAQCSVRRVASMARSSHLPAIASRLKRRAATLLGGEDHENACGCTYWPIALGWRDDVGQCG
jgi:hypothetical protein